MKGNFKIFLLILAGCFYAGVAGNPFRLKYAERLADFECNAEFKKTHLNLDYTFAERRPAPPSKDARAFCPQMIYSCCSDNEISNLFDGLKVTLSEVAKYYTQVQNEVSFFQDYDLSKIKEFYALKKKINKFGKCTVDGDDPLFATHILQFEAKKVASAIRRGLLNILRFYAGTACSMCDASDMQKIGVNPKSSNMVLTVDSNVCRTLFKLNESQQNLAFFALNLFKLTKAMLCNDYSKVSRVEGIIRDFETKIKRFKKALKSCRSRSLMHNTIVPDCACRTLCRKLFNYREWIDYYSVLGLLSYVKLVFNEFNEQQAKLPVEDIMLTDNHSYLDVFVGEGFLENRFNIFPPQIKSVYGKHKYEIILNDIEGINPFDHQPKTRYEQEEIFFT